MPRRIHNPSYTYKTKHGVYYFRFVIPAVEFSDNAPTSRGRSEIRFSLKTKDRATAIRHARLCRVLIDVNFPGGKITTMNSDDLKMYWITSLLQVNGGTLEVTADFNGDAKKEADAISTVHAAVTNGNAATSLSQMLFSDLHKQFETVQKNRKGVSQETLAAYKDAVDNFIFSQGDLSLSEITIDKMDRFYEDMQIIPRAKNKGKYKNLTITQIRLLEEEYSRRSIKTINGLFGYINQMLDYAVKQRLIQDNPAKAVSTITDKRIARDKRKPFNSDELISIFSHPFLTKHEWKGSGKAVATYDTTGVKGRRIDEPFKFWIHPIALLSGMRIGEIVSLRASDIKECNGIWYFDLSESDDYGNHRSLKSPNSYRQIPVHDQLIKIGILDYVGSLRNTDYLFPEFPLSKTDFPDAASKAARRFFDKALNGVPEDKSFHSYRHNFINHCMVKGAPKELTELVTGHRGQGKSSVLVSTYQKTRNVDGLIELLKKEVIDKVDYDMIDWDALKWTKGLKYRR